MTEAVSRKSVLPASLSFLAIYNPSLSRDDETLHEQIVYYYCGATKASQGLRVSGDVETSKTREDFHERLRQIGLAQGIVEFAKSFSDGHTVNSVETEKRRIVLHELEAGWWILASIDLTRITTPSKSAPTVTSPVKIEPTVEYSAREVSPSVLLLHQLLRGHQIFLLHHGPTLSSLFARISRSRFSRILRSYWDVFILDWDVLLNGNPAVDVFNGLKLAAGGELGIGVGEEEWGSGEREVLECFIGRTNGLVDLIVSRFGDSAAASQNTPPPPGANDSFNSQEQVIKTWQGNGQQLRPSDGVIFSGIGAITRYSIRDISSWVELLYKYGEDAYGVRDNPSATCPRKGAKSFVPLEKQHQVERSPTREDSKFYKADSSGRDSVKLSSHTSISPPDIPAPIVRASEKQTSQANEPRPSREEQTSTTNKNEMHTTDIQSSNGTETLMKYLTLGIYGSSWGFPIRKPLAHQDITRSDIAGNETDGRSHSVTRGARVEQVSDFSHGYFLIGLQGEFDQDFGPDDDDHMRETMSNDTVIRSRESDHRTRLRTLYVQRARPSLSERGYDDSSSENEHERLRVVVYVQRPFIFTFLFELQTDSLAIPSFYHSLHHQLGPLQRPLLASTSPNKVFERLREASTPKSTASISNSQPICDLVYDPGNLTVHTTIPNIPEPGHRMAGGLDAAASMWTRVEALSVHSQILNTYASTRLHSPELERTSKTSRGWWVVWMRLAQPTADRPRSGKKHREAFLIRKASDYVSLGGRTSLGRFGRDVSGSSAGGGGWGPGKLAEGIGIDARQYIEGLLSLNR